MGEFQKISWRDRNDDDEDLTFAILGEKENMCTCNNNSPQPQYKEHFDKYKKDFQIPKTL